MLVEEFLEQSANHFPDKVALITDKQRLTYRQIEERTNRLAQTLISEGVNRGDRVAVYLENSAEAVLSIFSILKAGAVFVVINPTTKTEKLIHILNSCRVTALVTGSNKGAIIDEAWPQVPSLNVLFVEGSFEIPQASRRILQLDRILSEGECSEPPAKKCIDIDLAALIYTSGSTGKPKGVMLTHLNIISAAASITTYLENRTDDIILSALPLAFDYGLYQVLMAFKIGGTLVLERSFTYPFAVIDKLIREKVTGFPIVPTMAAILLQMDLAKYNFSSLRYITNTAAALPAEHVCRLRNVFPHTRLYSMYGLTECKRVSYLPPEQLDFRPGSVGKGMPNEEVYIVDEEGRRVAPGLVGELVVRGSHVMRGYWELPEETCRMLRSGPLPGENVLYTGDLFKMDDEGYLYFVGRRDDIIKTAGEKVSPKEVEDVLCKLAGVAEAAVIGVPDNILGQSILGVIVLKEGARLDERNVLLHCKANLEDFMLPKNIVIRKERLPKSSNGKIDKRELSAELTKSLR